jgi:hypothetical protein
MTGIITDPILPNRRLAELGVDAIPPVDHLSATTAAIGSAAVVVGIAIFLCVVLFVCRSKQNKRSPYDIPPEGIIIGSALHLFLMVLLFFVFQGARVPNFIGHMPEIASAIAVLFVALVVMFAIGWSWTVLVIGTSRLFGYKGTGIF